MGWFDTCSELFGLAPQRSRPATWPPDLADAPAPPAPVDWDAVRDGIDEVRAALVTILDWLDLVDPTPLGLAQAAAVTSLDDRRR